jgi:hypothetical protein
MAHIWKVSQWPMDGPMHFQPQLFLSSTNLSILASALQRMVFGNQVYGQGY